MIAALIIPCIVMGQESDTDYQMVQLSAMKCKIRKYDEFEAAVKKHNAKHHKDKYSSNLWMINTGSQSGTYVWSMGPLTFTDMDGAPGKDEHAKDWKENVEIYVSEYGAVEYWTLAKELSNSDDKTQKYQTVWLLDIKKDNFHRFQEFMKKAVFINKKMGNEVSTWTNRFNEGDGRDVAIVFTFDKYAELDLVDWKMEEEFDKEYGDGSWVKALKDRNDFTNNNKRSQWSIVEQDFSR